MRLGMICGAVAAIVACGSAHAFSAKGNYDVTFSIVGGGMVQACATLQSLGASGPYRDVGYTTIYFSSGAATGTYLVHGKTISIATQEASQQYFLTLNGQFSGGQAFNTSVIEFSNQGVIDVTATFQYRRTGAPCTSSSN